jgi:uncharacterized FlaG/YvyC family protein
MAAINPNAPIAQQLVSAIKNAIANREGVITLEQQSQMSGAQRISRLTPNFDPIQRQPMKVERVDLGETGRLDSIDPREMAGRVRSVIGRLNPIMHNQTDLSFRLHEDSERFFVQVVDRALNEIVGTFPAEDFLRHTAVTGVFNGLVISDSA